MTHHTATLAARIADRSAVVAVIGLGYIGLPIAAAMVDVGFHVLGFDSDADKRAGLAAGGSGPAHLGADLPRRLLDTGRFEVCDDTESLHAADAVLICVPTPLDSQQQPDLSAVEDAARSLARVQRPGQLVVLESTTWPGTTREVLQPLLEAGGLRCGVDLFLAFAPEREDPGRTDTNSRAIPRLVGGLDAVSGELAVALYEAALDTVVQVSSAEVAEAAKLLENCYRAVNIALVNEFKRVLTALDVDVHEVIDAASTKPFGFQPFRPGPGLGGHCLPIDPFYLAWRARQVGEPSRFVELAGAVNTAMPAWVVERTCAALRADGIDPADATVLVIGLAYKADVDDVRESPSFALVADLVRRGARVEVHDPLVPRARPADGGPELVSVPLTAERLAGAHAVIVATDHSAVDWDAVATHARLVVDTRAVMRGRGGRDITA